MDMTAKATRLLLATALLAGCSAQAAHRHPAVQHQIASTLSPPQHGLGCVRGIEFRNIDNHKSEVVRTGWTVSVAVAGRTTYARHFDWQSPVTSPPGVLTLEGERHSADGGRFVVWRVTGTGAVHVELHGRRLTPSRLVPGEASAVGVFEVDLNSKPALSVAGCPTFGPPEG